MTLSACELPCSFFINPNLSLSIYTYALLLDTIEPPYQVLIPYNPMKMKIYPNNASCVDGAGGSDAFRPYRHWGPDYSISVMNHQSNSPTSQENGAGGNVNRLNGGREDTEGKNELQLITVVDKRGVSGVGCQSFSFLFSLSATVGDLKGMSLLRCW